LAAVAQELCFEPDGCVPKLLLRLNLEVTRSRRSARGSMAEHGQTVQSRNTQLDSGYAVINNGSTASRKTGQTERCIIHETVKQTQHGITTHSLWYIYTVAMKRNQKNYID
jgi:hypothetical protein